jgi:endoglucanase
MAVGGVATASASTTGSRVQVRASSGYGCSDQQYPAKRNPANPLMLNPAPPAGDPLRGAMTASSEFFVDGPKHGSAAGAIAHLLGIDTGTHLGHPLPSFTDGESWATFSQEVQKRLPNASPGVQYQVRMLEKIASEPETQRISAYSQGGSPAGIYSQTVKLFCHNFTADPGAIPIINTYFLHGTLHGCPTPGAINRYRPRFKGQINSIARATGRRPVVFLLELDYLGSSGCIAAHGSLPGWESLMRYEVSKLSALPHAVVYIEAGYSDSNGPRYTARALNRSDISKAQGFYTNDTHLQWTMREINWGNKVSRLTHGKHFIVSTSQNGRGPKLNPHPTTQGIEDLCNPPGRGLGPKPNTNTGFAKVDAFLWAIVPGNSSGCGGGPSGGTFWPARAVGLASRAQYKLGPGLPAYPY